jgi:hypothetical protein
MRTYKREKRFFTSARERGLNSAEYEYMPWPADEEPVACTCVFWPAKGLYLIPEAWVDCPNCFGYGFVPIDWRETI